MIRVRWVERIVYLAGIVSWAYVLVVHLLVGFVPVGAAAYPLWLMIGYEIGEWATRKRYRM